jgi:protein-L-isoaspartate(D-aspartate) O-methyltransferase
MPAHQLTRGEHRQPGAPGPDAPGWRQYNITFPEPSAAEATAARDLLPALTAAQDAGVLRRWWFIRKQPWKLRYLPGELPDAGTVSGLLGQLAAQGRITGWATGIYEPETLAFGGPEAMDVAYELFHHDSRCVLARAARQPRTALGRRETTVLLCSAMLRAAGLDWYEQGDVWAKVAVLRPAVPGTITPERAAALTPAMHQLTTAAPSRLRGPGCPVTGQPGWITAFEQAGRALAALARAGKLQRGLRAVLAHHIVFCANRAGLTIAEQAVLAALATADVFGDPPGAVFLPGTTPARG